MYKKVISFFLVFAVMLSCLFSLPLSASAEDQSGIIDEEMSNPTTIDCGESTDNEVDTVPEVTNDDYNMSLVSTGVSEDMYDKEYSKYIPYFVEKGEGVQQPLYNPESVYMLWDFCMSTYGIGKDNSWADAPQKYGYSQYYRVENNGIDGVGQDFTSSDNAIVGMKKVNDNGQEKYAIVVAFRGSGDIVDWLNNFSVLYTSDGIHSGFEVAANQFYENTKNMTFVIGQDTISLYDIIQDMKNEDSKYCMLVTGHSLGGAIADVYVGYKLYNDGINPKNVMTYTFAAPKSAVRSYNYPYRNIINIINEDDCVPTVGGDKQIGKNMIYSPDDDFRGVAYMNIYNYESGHSSKWWNNIVNFLNTDHVAHDLEPTYKKIILEFKEHTGKYTKYHTNVAPEEEHSAIEVRFVPNFRDLGYSGTWKNVFMVSAGSEIVYNECGSWPGTELSVGGTIKWRNRESVYYDCEVTGGSHVIFNNACTKLIDISLNPKDTLLKTRDLVIPDNCDSITIFMINGYYSYIDMNTVDVEFDSSDGEYIYRSISRTQVEIAGHINDKEDLTIPEKCGIYDVFRLGEDCFENDPYIKRIEIPDTIRVIDMGALDNCVNLETVSFDSGPARIDSCSFRNCNNLKRVNISSLSAWCNINFYSEESNPLYYANNLCINDKLVTELTIPDNIEKIKQFSFAGADCITSVKLGQNVTEINESAFMDCHNLKSIGFNSNLDLISVSAFSNCSSIEFLDLPNGLTKIYRNAFDNCNNLKSICFPNSIVTIYCSGFTGCDSLNHIYYSGSEEEWNAIDISRRESLSNIVIHFNSTGSLLFVKTVSETCTSRGYDLYRCTVCNKEYQYNYTDAKGHSYNNTVIPPTCEKQGYTLHKCPDCGDEYKDNVIEKVPHSFVNGICSMCGRNEDECIESNHPYENNCDKKWTITKKGAKRIAITFSEDTETESSWDYLSLYDNLNNEIDSYSGTELSGKRIVILGDSVTIRLVSDDSRNYYGFSITRVEVYYDECNHPNRELINYREATCGDKGYSGDYRCTECQKILEEGESIPATGDHHFVDGICTECSMKDPQTYPGISLGNTVHIDMLDDEQSTVYKYVPTNDMLVRFYSTGDADPIGYINDSNMNELVYDDDSGEDMNFEIVYLLKANELYLFEVEKYGDEDSFDISLVEIPVENIKVGDNKKVSGNSYFKFIPNKDMFIDFYSIESENSDYECYLYDSNFTILDTASYFDFSNFRLNYFVNANQVYYIACIYSFDSSESFEFDVTLKEVPLSPAGVGDTLTFNDRENYRVISVTDDMYISCYLKYESENLSCVYDASTMEKVGAVVNDNELVFLAEKGKKYIMYVSVDEDLGRQTVSLTKEIIPDIKLGETKKVTTSTSWAWQLFRFVPQNDITVRFSSSGDERFNVSVLNPNLEYMYVETNYIEDDEGETEDIQYVLEAGTEYIFAVRSESNGGDYRYSITLEDVDSVSENSILGDVDGDGTVTIIDATCIQRHLASIPTFAYNEVVADTDGDGEVTIIDATFIQRWLANLSSNDSIGKPIK